jgi:hypothetical protein
LDNVPSVDHDAANEERHTTTISSFSVLFASEVRSHDVRGSFVYSFSLRMNRAKRRRNNAIERGEECDENQQISTVKECTGIWGNACNTSSPTENVCPHTSRTSPIEKEK